MNQQHLSFVYSICVDIIEKEKLLKKLSENIETIDPFNKRFSYRKSQFEYLSNSYMKMADMFDDYNQSNDQEKHEREEDTNYHRKNIVNNTVFFNTGNSNIEIITGFIHLYQNIPLNHNDKQRGNTSVSNNNNNNNNNNNDNNMNMSMYDTIDNNNIVTSKNENTTTSHLSSDESSYHNLPLERKNILCVLSVPSFFSITDFYEFISSFADSISHMTVLRDEMPNRYMVLLEFKNQQSTDDFYIQYNGKCFNSFDPEECKLVYVKSIEYNNGSNNNNHNISKLCNENTGEISKITSSSSSPATATAAAIELPTCPVCLERLDSEVSGIVTTMCRHEFHCECFTKWGDGTCPVCRYSGFDSDPTCDECETKENLWICLTCGHVGCGRYVRGHARDHYQQTSHTYAMEIQSQRVWDYMGDGYVHRLIQNRNDGKLVQHEPNTGSSIHHSMLNNERDRKHFSYDDGESLRNYNNNNNGGGGGVAAAAGMSFHTIVPHNISFSDSSLRNVTQGSASMMDMDLLEAQYNSKMDALIVEYNDLLTKQLVSQRIYYEKQIKNLNQKKDEEVKELDQKMTSLKADVKKLSSQLERILNERKKQDEENNFLRQLNKTLINDQKQFKSKYEALQKQFETKLEEKDKTIRELQEQISDLMAHFHTQEKIIQNGEIREASLLVLPTGQPDGNNKKKAKKGKRKI